MLRRVKHFIYLLKNVIRFRHEAASAFLISSFFLFLLSSVVIFLYFHNGVKAHRQYTAPRFFYQKGHGAQKKGHGVMKKGHGAMPFYFSLDKTLDHKYIWFWVGISVTFLYTDSPARCG
jgi:hypothetical protein